MRIHICDVCGRREMLPINSGTTCHGQLMKIQDADMKIDLVSLKEKPIQKESWLDAWEVWVFKPTRVDGEKLGYLGRSMLAWEWVCGEHSGVTATKGDAIGCILSFVVE